MKNLTSSKLRIFLIIALLLLVAAGIALFLFGYDMVKGYAATTQETANQAATSNSSLQNLITTKKNLEDNENVVSRAEQLAAENKSYLYQDQIIKDINQFASESGLAITNIAFTDTKTTAVGAQATPAPSASGTTPATAAPAPNGIKSVTATVTLKTPIDYNNMLAFIHRIEQSLFRMQISRVSLSQAASTGKPNEINSDALTIEVYIR